MSAKDKSLNCSFLTTPTGNFGFNSDRPRYHVWCRTCDVLVHSDTISITASIRAHRERVQAPKVSERHRPQTLNPKFESYMYLLVKLGHAWADNKSEEYEALQTRMDEFATELTCQERRLTGAICDVMLRLDDATSE